MNDYLVSRRSIISEIGFCAILVGGLIEVDPVLRPLDSAIKLWLEDELGDNIGVGLVQGLIKIW